MNINILETALALSDEDLLARLGALSAAERQTTAELVAHLAALELRPSLYAALGYGSLFDYCTQVLRLSEDAACSRIRAARTCRAFPVVLDLLSSGVVSLTTVRLLQPHLTAENHETVLARAAYKRREEIERLVAELAPKPDVPSTMRKLPGSRPPGAPQDVALPRAPKASDGAGDAGTPETRRASVAVIAAVNASLASGLDAYTGSAPVAGNDSTSAPLSTPRPSIRASAPERYRVQFTIGQETHDKVLRLQALMRRELPSGDLAVIFDQAVDLMLEKVERVKLGAKARHRPRAGTAEGDRAYENRIRFRTDKRSRHIPNAVKRAVWRRDGGRCAFVSAAEHRCAERSFLEFHHMQPYALDGPATVRNISLRCRRHNAYEAEVDFGPRRPSPPSGTKPSATEAQ